MASANRQDDQKGRDSRRQCMAFIDQWAMPSCDHLVSCGDAGR